MQGRTAAGTEGRARPPVGNRAGDDLLIDPAAVVSGQVDTSAARRAPRAEGAGTGPAAGTATDARDGARGEREEAGVGHTARMAGWWGWWDSNPHCADFKSAASADWATRAIGTDYF